MRTRNILASLAAFFAVVALCSAADMMGTWKLNEAKSKFSPGATKNMTVTYEAAGDSTKVTVDGVDGDGKPVHSEWTGKFDGKDYPVTGDPTNDARSYRKINDHSMGFIVKKDGKAIVTGHIVVSPDGKSRTVRTSGTDSKGKKYTNFAAYDKQ